MKVVTLDRDLYSLKEEVYDWCHEHFGPSSLFVDDARWQMSLVFGHQSYSFKDHSDAALFMMRWGGAVSND